MRRVSFNWRQQIAAEQTHAELVLAAAQYLRLTGWLVIVTPRGGIPGAPGTPDIMAFKGHRRFLPIEVKVGRDRMSMDQVRVAGSLALAGFPVVEARTLDDVMRASA